jgi:uncharacterized membrane protein YozB (DUF420 family)
MSGFLGTYASFRSDLSLLFIFLCGAAAAYGGWQAREYRFSRHCPIMATAGLLNWVPIVLLMMPSWLKLVGSALRGNAFTTMTPAGILPVIHGVLAACSQLLITYTITRMYLVKSLPPERPIWLMRTTIFLWLLSAVGGIFIYVRTYIPI